MFGKPLFPRKEAQKMKAATELKANLLAILPPALLGVIIFGTGIILGIRGMEGPAIACGVLGLVIGIGGTLASWALLIEGGIHERGILIRYYEEMETAAQKPAEPLPQPGSWRDELREVRR